MEGFIEKRYDYTILIIDFYEFKYRDMLQEKGIFTVIAS